ncbi:tryptophan synthase subunit alpha [Sulfodiicoccus acidiphilus]|uniref:tryptophan synthase n=1 Tax=Sulfodiicoccus acidiphilus TaxID=1670455 RepID=A0A348B3E9_9CREN|nr:tryptophan synthase subunit alpha [Sulfodiicoccus acidiphilus]BBD72701.1 tryptophan synthase subunit alpha [Sulfodiicoccus acidiphilus]GGT95414.1 tryptophan synthase subunit alpha [Sulfodiicoccus acidiphilus]
MRKLVVYDTLGFPTPQDFLKFSEGLKGAGCDIYEVGLPPKYAKYDGPVIRRSHQTVSKFGDLSGSLKEAVEVSKVPVVVLTYLEEHLDRLREFLKSLRESKVEGVLFPDLLIDFPDQLEAVVSKVRSEGLKNVIFTAPSVPDSIIKRSGEITDMFLYYGVRPTTGIPIPVDVGALIRRVRNMVRSDLIVGFGLSSESDLRSALRAGADGVAVGTALITELEGRGVTGGLALVRKYREILDGA